MDYAACHVVYVDCTASEDKLVTRDDTISSSPIAPTVNGDGGSPTTPSTLSANVDTLLNTFSQVYVCSTGKACISMLSELNRVSAVDLIPIIVLIEMTSDEQKQRAQSVRTPSPGPRRRSRQELKIEELYGLTLLEWISSEIQFQSLSKLIIPVAVIDDSEENSSEFASNSPSSPSLLNRDPFASTGQRPARLLVPLDQARTMKYMDAGAIDVLTSPLVHERLPSLAIHAYRAYKDATQNQRQLLEIKKRRKRSWVGVEEQQPYAYLREAMVSGLMDGICKLGSDEEPYANVRIIIDSDRQQKVADAIGTWSFSAHDFTDDELLHAAVLMLEHTLQLPELAKWKISTDNLTSFLVASRAAYNAFVPYHNFRHVVDVLQAIFYFLVRLKRLPAYPNSDLPGQQPAPSSLEALIRPFDALTLLITAIGHDVGHPGVNNAFLVTLNAPLAQLYNDRSVLESFHCAAYSQILRRYWPEAFQNVEMRQLMINSILATDMGLHFDYMKKLGFLQDKLAQNGGTDGWNGRLLEEQRTLACSLLIKCADISNVARRYDIAYKWTTILTDEFARQASMEVDLGIPTALFAPPVREIIELGKSQIGFMNMFAIPLFQGVTDVMPDMAFCVDELHRNKAAWESRIEQENARGRIDSLAVDSMYAPHTLTLDVPSDAMNRRKSSSVSPFVITKTQRTQSIAVHDVVHESDEASTATTVQLTASPVSPSSESTAMVSANGALTNGLPPLETASLIASAPAVLSHGDSPAGSVERDDVVNGVELRSSVTDSAVDSEMFVKGEKQRNSNTTDSTGTAHRDSGSQATSATTSKLPLSPSTKGTSIASHESNERNGNSHTPTLATRSPSEKGHTSTQTSTVSEESTTYEGKGVLLETVHKIRKRPSRFRMNALHFWKRGKSQSPPMPANGIEGQIIGGSEEHFSWSDTNQ
ncbi:hypothetical protein F5884DRAFT_187352 [Xylogone sp. PMI_703]|nr:hypothetical protein F5884DRAFT_187352 [Xylogone sp. PMI_703]